MNIEYNRHKYQTPNYTIVTSKERRIKMRTFDFAQNFFFAPFCEFMEEVSFSLIVLCQESNDGTGLRIKACPELAVALSGVEGKAE